MLRRFVAIVSVVLLVPLTAQAMGSGGALLKKTNEEVEKKAEKPIVKAPDAPIVASSAKPIVSAAPPSWLNAESLAPIPKAVPLSAQPVPALNSSASPLVASPVGAVSSAPLAPAAPAPLTQKSAEELRRENGRKLSKEGVDKLNTAKDMVVEKGMEQVLKQAKGLAKLTAKAAVKGLAGITGIGVDLLENGQPKSLKELAAIPLKMAADAAVATAAGAMVTGAFVAAGATVEIPGVDIATAAGACASLYYAEWLSQSNVTGLYVDKLLGTHRYTK